MHVFTMATSDAALTLSNVKQLIFTAVLIFSLLAVGVSSFLIIEASKESGKSVTVTHGGEVILTVSLNESGEYSLLDGKNVLVIEDGTAYIKSADCPDKLCLHQGKISRTMERIVCLPNRLIIEVSGGDDDIFIN